MWRCQPLVQDVDRFLHLCFMKGTFELCPECLFDTPGSLSGKERREHRSRDDHKEGTQPRPLHPCKSCRSSALSTLHSLTPDHPLGSQELSPLGTQCWHSCCCLRPRALAVLPKWRQALAHVGCCCLYLRLLLMNFQVLTLLMLRMLLLSPAKLKSWVRDSLCSPLPPPPPFFLLLTDSPVQLFHSCSSLDLLQAGLKLLRRDSGSQALTRDM